MRRVLIIVLSCGFMLLPGIGASDSVKSTPKPQKTEPTPATKQAKPKAASKAKDNAKDSKAKPKAKGNAKDASTKKAKTKAKTKTKANATSKANATPKAKVKDNAKDASAAKTKGRGKGKGKEKIKKPEKDKENKKLTLVERIESSDTETVSSGITAVAKYKSRPGAKALVERVRGGLPPALLDEAIEALAAVNSTPTFKELIRLTDHRRTEVRVKVAEELGKTKRAAALKPLTKMLDDQQAAVRGRAATALGNTNALKAMKHLIVAAKRNVSEAAQVVGTKAKPHHVNKVLKSLDEKSFDALAPIFSKVLERKNIPKKTKLNVIEKVAAVGADGAASLLVKYASSLGKHDPMRKQISEALKKYDETQNEAQPEDAETKEIKAEAKDDDDKRGTGGAK